MGTQASFGCERRGSEPELRNSLSFVNKTIIKKALQMLGGTLVVLLLSIPAFSQASAGRLLGTAGLARGSELAHRFAVQAVAELQRYTSRTHLDAFEEVVRYVARRAA